MVVDAHWDLPGHLALRLLWPRKASRCLRPALDLRPSLDVLEPTGLSQNGSLGFRVSWKFS